MVREVLGGGGRAGGAPAVRRRTRGRRGCRISASPLVIRAKGMRPSTCSSAIKPSTVAAGPDVRFVVVSSDVVDPVGIDEPLRGEVPAAVQGDHRLGGRYSWQPRSGRCARSVRGHIPPAGGRRRANTHPGEGGTRTPGSPARPTPRIEHLIDEAVTPASRRARGPDGIPARAVSSRFRPIGFGARRDRHRHPAVDRSGASRMARRAPPAFGGKLTMAIPWLIRFFAGGHDATWAGGDIR